MKWRVKEMVGRNIVVFTIGWSETMGRIIIDMDQIVTCPNQIVITH